MIIENIREILLNKITGVIHVGAHDGEERTFYDDINCPIVDWHEANPFMFHRLQQNLSNHPRHRSFNHAVSNCNGRVKFNISSNDGESSSILPMKLHSQIYPSIHYIGEVEVNCVTLDSVYNIEPILFNFLYMDVQGAEYNVLEGSKKLLQNHIQYIYSEVNFYELYEGCKLMSDIDELLSQFGFVRTHLVDSLNGWGDALYQKR
jgi:FkbM family methyltransferase